MIGTSDDKQYNCFSRNGSVYECRICARIFSYSINLKKHVWLAHTKSQKARNVEHSNEKTVKISSNVAVKKVVIAQSSSLINVSFSYIISYLSNESRQN